MYDNLARQAIVAALQNDWETALKANLAILTDDPSDTDALNRSARAYLQLGKIKNAITSSEKVLAIDPVNSIALKCISKCNTLNSSGGQVLGQKNSLNLDNIFLEIPGRTKIVSLINLCESLVLAKLDAGEPVHIMPKIHKVAVTTQDEVYIGRLPDDLATRMIYFYKNGNDYQAFVKSVSDNSVTVFIKEIKRAEAISHVNSFPIRRFA